MPERSRDWAEADLQLARKDADEAISNAEAIIEFCQNHIH